MKSVSMPLRVMQSVYDHFTNITFLLFGYKHMLIEVKELLPETVISLLYPI